jgi:hypothetical protein
MMAVRMLMRRLTKIPAPPQQLKIAMKNLRLEVRLYIQDCDVDSIAELLDMGRHHERVKQEMDRFKPPPDIAQALVPEVAYGPKKLKPVKKPTLLSLAPQPDQGEVDEPSGSTSLPLRLKSSRRICWN